MGNNSKAKEQLVRELAGMRQRIGELETSETEQKIVVETLQRREEHFRSLIENLSDVIIVMNADGTIGYVGPSIQQVLGYQPEEWIGKTGFNLIHPDDLSSVIDSFNQSVQKPGYSGPAEMRVRHQDGSWRNIEGISRNLLDNPSVEGIVVNFRDITERRHAEDQLRESEQHHRVLMEMASNLGEGTILASDFEGRRGVIAYTNDAVTKILGYSREELLQMKMRDLVSPASAQEITERYLYRQAGDKTEEHYESVALAKDGTEVPVQVETGNTIYQGKPAIVAFIRDITERRYIEDQLRESEAKYSALVQQAMDGIIILGQDGLLKFVSESALEISGYTAEEIQSMFFLEMVHPECREKVAEKVKLWLLGDQAPFTLELKALCKDGEVKDLETRSRTIEYSGGPAIMAVIRDITERKRSEEALKRREEHFRSLIENVSDVAMVLGADGVVSYLSPSIERVLGYQPEERIGKPGFDLIHPDDLPIVLAAFNKSFQMPGYTESMEVRVRHKDGSWHVLQGVGNNLLTYPSVAGIVVNFRDITASKRAEKALQKRNRELATLNRIAQSLSRSIKLDNVLQTALDSMLELMSLSVGAIYLVDENAEELLLVTYRGVSEELAKLIHETSTLPLGMIFSSKVAVTGKVLVIRNLSKQLKPPYSLAVERDGLRYAIGIPLKSKGRTLGVICMSDYRRRDLSAQEIQLLETIGGQIGVAIENARLFEKVSEQSVTDELTGLYNRRHFYKVLEGEIYRTERYGHSFSLVMLDLDGFKGYNDKLGHTNGDVVLKSLAQTLKAGLRKSDIAFRYGGDEFTIILPATDADRAKVITDRIQSKWLTIPELEYPLLDNPLGFSAGIAQFPKDAETVGDLIFLADAALYHSKRQGGYRSALVSELETIPMDITSVATPEQVYALASTVDARDSYTYGHSKRVADISDEIGRNLGLSIDELASLNAASLLHDIGKVGIPDSILAKPAELTKREWGLMKKHASEGARIIGCVKGLASLVPIIRHHHEWYNSMGYPDGLKGEEIPIAARIISVADAYDTMVTPRPYRSVISQEEALEELKRCSGTQFAPEVVEVLCQVLKGSNCP